MPDLIALICATPIPMFFFGLCCLLQAYRHQDAWWRAGTAAGYLLGLFVIYPFLNTWENTWWMW